MKGKGKCFRHSGGRRVSSGVLTAVLPILLLFFTSSAYPGDYPGGATTHGVVVSIGTFDNSFVRFSIQGTKANGQPGTESFWIDTSQINGKNHYVSVLAAAAQGRSVSVWHYGDLLNYGGQVAYGAVIIWANYH